MPDIRLPPPGPDGIQASSLRDQPLRRRLLGLIQERPGLHASDLARESGEPWGTVQYHLSLLRRGCAVRVVEAGRERRFFPTGVDPTRARLLALLGRGRRPEIASFIRHHPGARQVDICGALELSRKTFRSSVAPLVEAGLVQERRGLQSNRYYPQPALDGLVPAPPPLEAAPAWTG